MTKAENESDSSAVTTSAEQHWESLQLGKVALQNSQTVPVIDARKLISLLQGEPDNGLQSWEAAVSSSVSAYEAEAKHLDSFQAKSNATLSQLDDMVEKLESLASTLQSAETSAMELRTRAEECRNASSATDVVLSHLAGFIDQIFIEPALIRHIVDGKVGDRQYGDCLSELSKKAALFEMEDIRSCAAYAEVNEVLKKLIATAIARVQSFLVEKVTLLKRPNTNVNIVKESVLLPHRALVDFVEVHAPAVFREIKDSYVETMSRTYNILFRRYTAVLLTMKQMLPSESGDTLVGSLLSDRIGLWGSDRTSKTAGVGQFALGERLSVLQDVEGPAIVLATAVDNKERFFYEQIHRSLGKMLSETCASEHMFCEHFFGEGGGRMFNVFFQRIVGFLLDAVRAHTAPTRDTIGVLLALKVNEAQRCSMVQRNIMDLSDFFIQVDIILKPKFKKLLDENVASVMEATSSISKSASRSDGDTSPHIVTRRFAEFASSLLAIARFGTPDDSILEGLRRIRSEFHSFINAVSTLFTRQKLRYIFLLNNINHVLTMFRRHNVSGSEDYRLLIELQTVHTAAYVEHEVADHFPDIVSFVRQFERTLKMASVPSENKRALPTQDRVRAVLRQFASNWRLSVQHLQDNVLREFPNYDLGAELTRSMFARILAYHKRCENAVNGEYPSLNSEMVTGAEITAELRKRTSKI